MRMPKMCVCPRSTRWQPINSAAATAATPSTSMIGSAMASMFTTIIALW